MLSFLQIQMVKPYGSRGWPREVGTLWSGWVRWGQEGGVQLCLMNFSSNGDLLFLGSPLNSFVKMPSHGSQYKICCWNGEKYKMYILDLSQLVTSKELKFHVLYLSMPTFTIHNLWHFQSQQYQVWFSGKWKSIKLFQLKHL